MEDDNDAATQDAWNETQAINRALACLGREQILTLEQLLVPHSSCIMGWQLPPRRARPSRKDYEAFRAAVLEVTSPAGTFVSDNALVTVQLKPILSVTPVNPAVVQGSPASFTVTAGGATPITFQWRKNGTNLPGATGATFWRHHLSRARPLC